ncbi:10411_t:CDS:2 [Cetraspora pellucida]|uniref:10411_t:CDS:1 n=1 Tax=Cetraspora pellucida TaxID=1433469 RepID=A0ACA9PAW8_9GLOM|nr:10411_t:CDS:2 [Cetraspora pellucida]
MLRILSKIIVEEQISCKANTLPKDIITQYLQDSENLKNLCLYDLVVKALTRNLHHKKQATLSNEVAKQSTIHTKLLVSSKSSSDEKDYASNASDASDISEVNLTATSI